MADLVDSIKRLNAELDRIQAERDELLRVWAKRVFPYKVGDYITAPTDRREKGGSILSFDADVDNAGDPYVIVRYRPLRKDGVESASGILMLNWTPAPEDKERANG